MLRLSSNLIKLTISQDVTFYQTVRWRKPIWMPVAKSKLFRIRPKQRIIFPGEPEEVTRLFNNYRTGMKSIRRYLNEKYSLAENDIVHDPEEQNRIFQEDFARCSAINEKWNAEQKVRREKYVAESLEEQFKVAKVRVEEHGNEDEKKKLEIEEFVRAVKEDAKHFIKPEDIDKVIDEAFANPVDYNYALTLEGQKIVGRENNNVNVTEEVAIKQ